MFTWGPKYLFAISFSALVGAAVYGVVTGGDWIGVLTAGYKGGVGDHFGYSLLLAAFLTAQVVGWILVATRDGDAEAMAARAGVAVVPEVTPPADRTYWGLMVAFGVAGVIVGLAVDRLYFYLGLVVMFVAGLEWLVQAWSDRASGDLEVNRIIRARIAGPFEIPVMSLLGFAVLAIAVSRVFLAASATGAVIAGGVVTLVIFVGAILMANFDFKPVVLRGALIFAGVAVLAAGIVGAAVGERDFHHGEGEEHSDEDGAEEDGPVEGEGE